MKLYLDLCALKRPFDDQSQPRITAETQAVLAILGRIEQGVDSLAWSSVLTLENNADPEPEPRIEVAKCAARAAGSSILTPQVVERIRQFAAAGLRPLDAAHLAFAEAGRCEVLITCDDRFVERAGRTNCLLRVLNPIEYYSEVGDA